MIRSPGPTPLAHNHSRGLLSDSATLPPRPDNAMSRKFKSETLSPIQRLILTTAVSRPEHRLARPEDIKPPTYRSALQALRRRGLVIDSAAGAWFRTPARRPRRVASRPRPRHFCRPRSRNGLAAPAVRSPLPTARLEARLPRYHARTPGRRQHRRAHHGSGMAAPYHPRRAHRAARARLRSHHHTHHGCAYPLPHRCRRAARRRPCNVARCRARD